MDSSFDRFVALKKKASRSGMVPPMTCRRWISMDEEEAGQADRPSTRRAPCRQRTSGTSGPDDYDVIDSHGRDIGRSLSRALVVNGFRTF